ncbi:MAG: ABC transporter substrate-binding protein [Bdellovibrionales bacterium]|nr:ABC transporter substrate-binding protein [Bdellovibrionales bacterium]
MVPANPQYIASKTATLRNCVLVGLVVFGCLAAGALSHAAGPRLATTSPDSTQLLVDLGLGPQIAATVQPEVLGEPYRSLPSLGSLYLPNIEKLLATEADEVVVDESLHQVAFQQALKHLGISHIGVHITSLESLIRETTKLENALGGQLPPNLRRCANTLNASTPSPYFSFLLLAWTNPAMGFGQETLLSDILHAFGGENLVPRKWNQSYPQLSVEWLLQHRPNYVFVVTYTDSDVTRAKNDIEKWWPNSDTKLIALPAKHFSHANFSPLKSLRQLGLAQIHPGTCP